MRDSAEFSAPAIAFIYRSIFLDFPFQHGLYYSSPQPGPHNPFILVGFIFDSYQSATSYLIYYFPIPPRDHSPESFSQCTC